MECQTFELAIMLTLFGILPLAGFAYLATQGEKKKEKTIEELYDTLKKKGQQIDRLALELQETKMALFMCQNPDGVWPDA
jgi:hypothetical protein